MNDTDPIPDEDFAAAERFLSDFVSVLPITPPPGFADRVVRVELRRRTRVATLKVCVASGLAAAVALAFSIPAKQPAAANRPELAAAATPVRITEKATEARTAVVSLTRKTTEETFAPAVSLFAASTSPAAVKTSTSPPLAEMPSAAKAGVEPLTNTARRAVNLFRRDVVAAANF